MTTAFAHAPGRRRTGSSASLGVSTALAVGLALAAVAYVAVVLWPRWVPPAPDAPALPITVGDTVLNIPAAAIRVGVQRRTGAQDRLDLAYLWPDLTPPDPSSRPSVSLNPITVDRLFITVSSAEGNLGPTERIGTIYARYLGDTPLQAPDGLRGLPFRDDTPYAHEDLFMDAVSADVFAARCSRAEHNTPGTCLLERRMRNVNILVRFPRAWLGEWRALRAGVDRLIAGWKPASG
jgi:hypothetical protein